MHRFYVALLAVAALCAPVASAGERQKLGYGRLIVNDFLGDTQDRWRTGSVASSYIYGKQWSGAVPTSFGELLEVRILGEIISPDNLRAPAAGDRPYVGSLSLGVHTHFQKLGWEFAVGGDVVAVGPQTGLDGFQASVHDLLNIPEPSAAVRAGQVGNQILPAVVLEAGREYNLTGQARVRPFVEGKAGVETLVRAGVDLTFGSVGMQELLVRDAVTGHRYRTIQKDVPGVSVVLGADVAKVFDSVYLPASGGHSLTDARARVRAGVHWQGEQSSVFYGITWLGEEFAGQGEGQLVGALRLKLRF